MTSELVQEWETIMVLLVVTTTRYVTVCYHGDVHFVTGSVFNRFECRSSHKHQGWLKS